MKRNFAAPLLALSMFFISLSGNYVIAQTVIGGSTPDPSAMLDVQSTSKGVLMPRMTTTQRNSITAPATGLVIFNTTTECLEINLGTSTSPTWTEIKCPRGSIVTLDADNSRLTGSVLMPTVAASMNSARVPYTGGNGKDHDGQTVTSTGVTGLTAILSSGNFAVGDDSLTYNISGTPSGSGLAIFVLNIGGQMSTLRVPVGCGAYVAANTWKVFSCYNLGAASTSLDPFTPRWEINGGYWQWGRAAEAAPGPTGTIGSPPTEHYGDCPQNYPSFGAGPPWNGTPAPSGSWVDATPMTASPADNPCPSGFRVPTKAQWIDVLNNNLVTDAPGSTWVDGATNYNSGKKFGTNLMLPAAGTRDGFSCGPLYGRNNGGTYWSSTEDGSGAAVLVFYSGSPYMDSNFLQQAFSVRCIAE
jgi:uncharacterized protein (TIGR02145 family)